MLVFTLLVAVTAGADAEETNRAPFRSFARVVACGSLEANEWDQLIIQSSVRELRHPKSGIQVLLVSMCHTGRPAYYRGLTRFVQDAEIVLAGGTGGMPAGTRAKYEELPEVGRWIRRGYTAAARLRGLYLQHQWEASVVDDRWRMADLDRAQIEKSVKGQEKTPFFERYKAMVKGWEDALSSKSPDAMRKARRGAFQHNFRDVMTRDLATRRAATAKERQDLSPREEVMWETWKRHLTSGSYKRVALVVGGWHAYKLEPRLISELGYQLHSSVWLDNDVWTKPD